MAVILNTRAELQAKAFSLALIEAKHTSIECPAMTISPIDSEQLELAGFDVIIFVSQNAAHFARPHITPAWRNVFAVGAATKAALPDFVKAHYPPQDFSTAGLLAMQELTQVANKKIAIICGANTKPDLGLELTARKAEVTTFSIYKRTLCASSIAKIQQLPDIDIITSFSAESLRLLNGIIIKAQMNSLKSKPLIVVTKKMMTLALELGFSGEVYLAKDATVAAMLTAIREATGG